LSDRKPFPADPASKIAADFQAHPAPILETLEYILLFALFLGCSTPYRIMYNTFSVGVTELTAWIYILWRWIAGGRQGKEETRVARWLIRGIWILTAWSAVIWLVSSNSSLRRGMVLDWVLAALVLQSLLRSPVKDWRRIAMLFVLAALPNVLLGGLQHGMGIGLSPKDLAGWGKNAASFPIYGFFGHSNDLAVYLYWPVVVGGALIFSSRSWLRLSFIVLTMFYGLVLYWTISRSTLIALGTAAVFLVLLFLLPRKKVFLIVSAALFAAAALFLAWVFLSQPQEWINKLLSGRLTLWSSALRVIFQDPGFLPLGYLAMPPAELRVFWIPHNMYLLAWIQFGWPGILLLAGSAFLFAKNGADRYEQIRTHRPAAVTWSGLAGLFLVNGMAILYLHETYVIVHFICLAAIWFLQIREIDRSADKAGNLAPARDAEPASARTAPPSPQFHGV
jgi:hypothetical protein